MAKTKFKGSVILNPVPVVLITTKNKEGKTNVFTVAWAGTINTKPPMLSISVRPERLSYEYIKETMEFVVNMPSANLTKKVDYCGVRSGKKEDKIKEMNFSLTDSDNVSVPYINECPVNIECKVHSIIPLGTHDLILADVIGSYVDESLIDEKGKIHLEQADLITYCHGEYFKMPQDAIGKFGYSVAKNTVKASTPKKKASFKKETTTKKTDFNKKEYAKKSKTPSKAKNFKKKK
ncbi:NADH-FMN oxidoreductase RutF, flavin reductase (DIM6/NTAB) family [Clostridium cavendishii DSM 21758]|uniref:NADH-FMN oxidoreductase RutF, flavin reductase (DIM6/NTAB) family n=1 Tax=Clostridium cavendishii DSM 21758 TaxID=1121302 RepID=A0A1M6VC97_9CLOT|nr:flavin reductase family protein [Clostridium cavendishii]SHK78975.1 NADH-FMN oxidoreductase RutF, flavin reductase (DIM6/NTAB) family [Clostridium cavendishii DSM 21758]